MERLSVLVFRVTRVFPADVCRKIIIFYSRKISALKLLSLCFVLISIPLRRNVNVMIYMPSHVVEMGIIFILIYFNPQSCKSWYYWKETFDIQQSETWEVSYESIIFSRHFHNSCQQLKSWQRKPFSSLGKLIIATPQKGWRIYIEMRGRWSQINNLFTGKSLSLLVSLIIASQPIEFIRIT